MEASLVIAIVVIIYLCIVCVDLHSDLRKAEREYKNLEKNLEETQTQRNYWKEEYLKDEERIKQHSEGVIDFVRRRAVEETSKEYIDYIKQILYTLYFRHGEKEFEIDPRAEKMKDSIDIVETNIEGQNKTLKVVFKETKLG